MIGTIFMRSKAVLKKAHALAHSKHATLHTTTTQILWRIALWDLDPMKANSQVRPNMHKISYISSNYDQRLSNWVLLVS